MGGSLTPGPGYVTSSAAAAGSAAGLVNQPNSVTTPGAGPLSTVAALASNMDMTKQPLGVSTGGSTLGGAGIGGRGKTAAEVVAAIVKRTGLPPKQVMVAMAF